MQIVGETASLLLLQLQTKVTLTEVKVSRVLIVVCRVSCETEKAWQRASYAPTCSPPPLATSDVCLFVFDGNL